jgi:trehalose-phosphatase
MRQTLRTLAARLPVAILTGRDLDDVRGRVHVDGIVYAGSHGFDIAGAGGLRRELGAAFLPVLDTAEAELREALDDIAGAQLERKHFSVAAHYRNVNESDASGIAQAVDAVARKHRELRKINGKKVYELLPDIDWNKGRAVLWLLETLELEGGEAFPIFIGDDRTDEDAFSALKERGAGILVSEQPQVTAANYWLRNPEDVERFLQELIVRLPG